MALTLPTPGYPGATGGYIPNFLGGESAGLIVSYSRDPKKFLVNKLLQITQVDKLTGYWKRANPGALARIYSDPDEAIWPDGAEAPRGYHNEQDISNAMYNCKRRAEADTIGYQTAKQSAYPLREMTTHTLAHRMMTRRAVAFYTRALSTDYYLSANTATVAAIAGPSVTWANATGTNPYIYKTMMYAASTVTKATVGAIQFRDMTMVLSPDAAYQTAATEEIRNYLAQSPDALAQIRGDKPGQNASWGLPDQLYGMKVEVDPTIQNIGPRLATDSNSYLATSTKAIFLCRPGDTPDNATQFSSAFSSWHLFTFQGEEMLAEEFDEPLHRRTHYRLTDCWDIQPVAPETAFLATLIF